jgi:uncharacterized oligopeptide transporter (OPT) family protein
MLASVLRLSGLDRRLAAFKLRLDEKAYEAVDHVKAVVVRMFVVAALAVAAAVFALLALITGLVALYGWLEPTYGVLPALSIVGGVLAVIALVLISAAMILSRGRPGSEKGTATPETIEVPPSPLPLSVTPAPVDSVDSPPSAASAATAGDKIEPILSVVKRYAHIPRTGSAPVDDFIRQMEPRVELATKEAVTRAATLVQTGDRATMLAVLGAAMAVGWLLVKAANPSVVSNR